MFVDCCDPNIFKALSDPSRLSIFAGLLGDEQEVTVSIIAERSKVDPSVVSRHLKLLLDAKLVDRRKEGRLVFYKANAKSLAKVLRDIATALDNSCCVSKCC